LGDRGVAGINRALHENRHIAKINASIDTPCIFLSHISVDKPTAIALAKYIMNHGGIDVYLDIHDEELQLAVAINDPIGITDFIEQGLSHSTHIMCLVSASTVRSWWVPYELGFAKKAGKHLSTLKVKGEIDLPAYLEISTILRGIESLNDYLTRVRRTLEKRTASILSEALIPEYAQRHPLDQYLDWNA
jgi:hypothetical protein